MWEVSMLLARLSKGMDKGRKADLAEISSKIKAAKGKQKIQLEKAGRVIVDEQKDPWIRSARESLIEAARTNKAGNVRDVSEDIMKRKEKNMGLGKTSFFFSFDNYDQIFGKK